MESARSSSVDQQTLRRAFALVHCGYSADRVIADPELNGRFVSECRTFALNAPAIDLNRALMNLRKSGNLGVKTTERTSFDDDDYQFASEIAIRMMERRHGISLDDILCDPIRASEFDQLARSIAPRATALQYRWAALSLRKQRELPPEVASRILRPTDAKLVKLVELSIDSLPRQPGIYAFIDNESQQTLYIGEASNLRNRLSTHVEHSDNKHLARHMWKHGINHVLVEFYVLPDSTTKRELRAMEAEQIRFRKPEFNIAGLL